MLDSFLGAVRTATRCLLAAYGVSLCLGGAAWCAQEEGSAWQRVWALFIAPAARLLRAALPRVKLQRAAAAGIQQQTTS